MGQSIFMLSFLDIGIVLIVHKSKVQIELLQKSVIYNVANYKRRKERKWYYTLFIYIMDGGERK